MTILFTQYWDVKTNHFDDYSNFITNEYHPTMEQLGIRLLGGYYVAVGQGPRVVAVATVDQDENLIHALARREYRIIFHKLNRLVWDYSSKVWAPTGQMHEEPYRIRSGAWKFNQFYNIVPGKEEDHYRFVKEECVPALKELGIPITGGWRLAIGSGPRILAETTARNMVAIAEAVDTSVFRKLVRTLKKNYGTDYSSKILAPTGRIEVPFIMREMMKSF
jgi:hypothetical protein